MPKNNVIKRYNLPETICFCSKCTVSNQRPRITFNANGICSACQYSEFKKKEIDWDKREGELISLCNKFRKNDGSYDVLVPVSGGKDGSFVAHQLKTKYGMNPLTVTWSPLVPTDIGRKNLDDFVNSGFDNILGRANGQVTQKLTQLAFKHLGDPFQPFIYGQTNFPLKMAVQHKIPLIMYGENGEVEYGGDMTNAFRPTRELSDHDKHYFSGMPPEFWADHGLSLNELKTFAPPSFEQVRDNGTEIHFFGYYQFWDPQENYYYSCEHTGFVPNDERSEGTYSKYASLDDQIDGFHYYLSYIKFGIGRTTSDTAHEIRDGKIDREEGIALIKRYDGEFPERYFKVFLDYCNITESEFWEIIDQWRSDHIWRKVNGQWKLRKAIYD